MSAVPQVAAALDVEQEFFMGLPADFPEELLAHMSYEFPAEMLAGTCPCDCVPV